MATAGDTVMVRIVGTLGVGVAVGVRVRVGVEVGVPGALTWLTFAPPANTAAG